MPWCSGAIQWQLFVNIKSLAVNTAICASITGMLGGQFQFVGIKLRIHNTDHAILPLVVDILNLRQFQILHVGKFEFA